MANPHGSFLWYELITPDPDAAESFYTAVAGWSVARPPMKGMDYRILSAPDGDNVGGLMRQPEGMSGGASWFGYITVDDVDAAAADVVAAGGAVHMPPTTIEGVGRLAMVADPQGTPFYVMRGANEGDSRAFVAGEHMPDGHFVWNELSAADPDAAIAFYQARFGWGQEGAMPMAPLGEYRFLQAGADAIGAAMPVPPGGRPGWLFYIAVPAIDAAADRVRAGGGMVVQEPTEIPGGYFSLVALDPQGAAFGLVGPRQA